MLFRPRTHREHHGIGVEFVARCELYASDLVAIRRKTNHLSADDFGAEFFRSLGHGERELVGLHLTRGIADAAHVFRVQRRKRLSQRIGVEPIALDAACFLKG